MLKGKHLMIELNEGNIRCLKREIKEMKEEIKILEDTNKALHEEIRRGKDDSM